MNIHPIVTGLFIVLGTVVFGMTIAMAAGLTTPSQVFAQVVGPGCCTLPPPPPPEPIPPPPPPVVPIIISGCTDPSATNYNPAATVDNGSCTYPVAATVAPAPIIGCMDPTATNYNPAATSQTGVVCTYPPGTVFGCMDPTATNYNPAATSQVGITCTYPSGGGGAGGPSCTLSTSPTTVASGATSVLTWTTSSGVSFSIDNGIGAVTPIAGGSTTTPVIGANTIFTGTVRDASNATATCTASVAIITGGGGGGGGGGGSGGGGGGGAPAPIIVLSSLLHAGVQPLAYLYLSQIPQTGLVLGPTAMMLYWIALVCVALVIAYLMLFTVAPAVNERARNFASTVGALINEQGTISPVAVPPTPPAPVAKSVVEEMTRDYSPYHGFKSFASNGVLSIDDIVKGLSRSVTPTPVVEHVEPIYEHIEPIIAPVVEEGRVPVPPGNANSFATALVMGDRVAVFGMLREEMKEGNTPEKFIARVACLFDDAYRTRIDGTPCDADIARVTARLDTKTLEQLIIALTTAVDASYSSGITGAKLALIRALSVLGA